MFPFAFCSFPVAWGASFTPPTLITGNTPQLSSVFDLSHPPQSLYSGRGLLDSRTMSLSFLYLPPTEREHFYSEMDLWIERALLHAVFEGNTRDDWLLQTLTTSVLPYHGPISLYQDFKLKHGEACRMLIARALQLWQSDPGLPLSGKIELYRRRYFPGMNYIQPQMVPPQQPAPIMITPSETVPPRELSISAFEAFETTVPSTTSTALTTSEFVVAESTSRNTDFTQLNFKLQTAGDHGIDESTTSITNCPPWTSTVLTGGDERMIEPKSHMDKVQEATDQDDLKSEPDKVEISTKSALFDLHSEDYVPLKSRVPGLKSKIIKDAKGATKKKRKLSKHRSSSDEPESAKEPEKKRDYFGSKRNVVPPLSSEEAWQRRKNSSTFTSLGSCFKRPKKVPFKVRRNNLSGCAVYDGRLSVSKIYEIHESSIKVKVDFVNIEKDTRLFALSFLYNINCSPAFDSLTENELTLLTEWAVLVAVFQRAFGPYSLSGRGLSYIGSICPDAEINKVTLTKMQKMIRGFARMKSSCSALSKLIQQAFELWETDPNLPICYRVQEYQLAKVTNSDEEEDAHEDHRHSSNSNQIVEAAKEVAAAAHDSGAKEGKPLGPVMAIILDEPFTESDETC